VDKGTGGKGKGEISKFSSKIKQNKMRKRRKKLKENKGVVLSLLEKKF